MDASEAARISALDDVELIKILTIHAAEQSEEVLALATEEAQRRGVPIDEAFIPRESGTEADPESRQWVAAGIALNCLHCGADGFRSREIVLNTRAMTFFDLDWLNRGAHAMECATCGLVQIFAKRPTPLTEC
ncbi:MAG: hypothetical protein IT457_19025 [Planctomycetes bacterium]|nr:hypothetical protein [Planctomycetota bacterium]